MIATNKEIQTEIRQIIKDLQAIITRIRSLESLVNQTTKISPLTPATRKQIHKMNDAIDLLHDYILGDHE